MRRQAHRFCWMPCWRSMIARRCDLRVVELLGGWSRILSALADELAADPPAVLLL
jgi:hypothetical protein